MEETDRCYANEIEDLANDRRANHEIRTTAKTWESRQRWRLSVVVYDRNLGSNSFLDRVHHPHQLIDRASIEKGRRLSLQPTPFLKELIATAEPRLSLLKVAESEMTEVSELPVNPKGRIAFQEFGGLAWRDRCRGADEHVGVVVDAANLYSDHFVFTGTAADTSPDIVLDLRPDKI